MSRQPTQRELLAAAEARAAHWQRIAKTNQDYSDADKHDLWDRAMRAESFIRSLGYIKCDIAACNCNSWHKEHVGTPPLGVSI